jgi:sterol desaturase/sphingolipid hydroxylase (fatty acid hydroxylase superfamily)
VDVFGYEPWIRLGSFTGVLLLLTVWELLAPRRRRMTRTLPRWLSNLGLATVNTVAVRFLVPLSAVGAAFLAEERRWGALPNVAVPDWLKVLLAVVALDFIIYLQHVLFHAVPALWRLHMVHHADLDLDATSGVRFHTVEILLSMGIKVAGVVVLGAPALAVVLFEVLLNATSMFNHANVRLSRGLDRLLRLVLVTPDMHRVHHSVHVRETNSNFGFNLPWWDYLLGTYRDQPADGHEGMALGLGWLRDERRTGWLHRMLLLPFLGQGGGVPISRRGTESEHPTKDRIRGENR